MELNHELTEKLLEASAEEYGTVMEENQDAFLDRERPFFEYIRSLKLKKGLKWTVVADTIGYTDKELYKLITGEKVTRQRDKIIRLGFGMHLSLEEMQKALAVYGFPILYVRRRRDLLLMKLLQEEIWSIPEADLFLQEHGEAPLLRKIHS